MANNPSDLGRAASPDLTVQTLYEVDTTAKQFPSPALVTNTMLPEDLTGEGREGGGRITDEAADCVCVHAQQERDEKVVSVPERLERLLSNPVVGGRVHQQHAKKHHVTRDSTGLGVVNLNRKNGSNLCPLDVEEAAIISDFETCRVPF